MGEIADDMIDGLMCELCGCYFTEEHGHPATCEECWKDLNKRERKIHTKAIYPTL